MNRNTPTLRNGGVNRLAQDENPDGLPVPHQRDTGTLQGDSRRNHSQTHFGLC